jgi:predicted small metal-binding protein
MTKEFACKDIGMNDDYRVEGRSEQELMPKIAEHARTAHNMNEISPDTMEKIKGAIRDKD